MSAVTENATPFPPRLFVLLLTGVLIFFSVSMLWPMGAFPHVALVNSTAFLLAGGAALAAGWRVGVVPGGAAFWLAAAWALVWVAGWMPRELRFAAGRDTLVTVSLSVIVYTGVFAAVRAMVATGLPCEFPARITARWLAVLLGVLGLFAVYQVYGPAGFPRTFATMERDVADAMQPGDPLLAGILHAIREARAFSTLGAPNIFASFCVFGVIASAGLALGERDGAWRAVGAAAALASLAGLILSRSNGAALALIASALVFAGILLCRTWPRRRIIALFVTICAAVALLLVAVAAVSWIAPTEQSRLLSRSGMTQRFFYWQSATSMWAEKPMLGLGAGGYEIAYPQHRMPGANETRVAHSWLFQHLAEVGIIGTAAFLLFLAAAAWSITALLARWRDDKHVYTLFCGLSAACAGLVIHGMIEYTLSFREGSLLLFLALGILTASTPAARPAPVAPRAMLLPAAAYAILGAALVYTLVPPLRAEAARDEAEYLILSGGDRLAVLSAYRRAVEADPRDPVNWEARGLFRLQTGDTAGLQDLEKAVELHPLSARLRERLARYHAARRDWQRAIEYQRQAVELHPLDVPIRLDLTEMLRDAGDLDEARNVYTTTLNLLAINPMERERRERLGRELGVTQPPE